MKKLKRYKRFFEDTKHKVGDSWNSTEGRHKLIKINDDQAYIKNIDIGTVSIIPIDELDKEINVSISLYNSEMERRKENEKLASEEKAYKDYISKIMGKYPLMKMGNLIKSLKKTIMGKTYKDFIEKSISEGFKISDKGILVPLKNIDKDTAIGYKLDKYQTDYAIKYGEYLGLDNHIWRK